MSHNFLLKTNHHFKAPTPNFHIKVKQPSHQITKSQPIDSITQEDIKKMDSQIQDLKSHANRRAYQFQTTSAQAGAIPLTNLNNIEAGEQKKANISSLKNTKKIVLKITKDSLKLPASLTNPTARNSPSLDQEIKFKSIGKRTVAGVKNGFEKINQDAIFIDTNILGKKYERVSVFAIFDGHGQKGDKVSRFLINNLKETFRGIYHELFGSIESQTKFKSKAPGQVKSEISFNESYDIGNEKKLYKLMIQLCIFLNVKLNDQQMFRTNFSGSTGIIVVCLQGKIVTANVGDSRALLITKKPHQRVKKWRGTSIGSRVHSNNPSK